MDAVKIADRLVGPGQPCFIVAEAGVNHNGRPDMATRLIDAAADAGADAVKFQTFDASRLAGPAAPKAAYQLQTTDQAESQRDMLRRLQLPPETYAELQAHARRRSIMFLSTPFDEESADLLDGLGVPAFKIASGDLTNLPLLAHVARKGRLVILSTGMSRLAEVCDAVAAIRTAGNSQIVLLQCVSNYPADPADANLKVMQTLREACHVPVGYSDHTLGIEVALAAAALGACMVEKHVTLDRLLLGPDHAASLEPDELRALVRSIRLVEISLGHGRKEPAASEADTAATMRRSLVAARDISEGTVLTDALLAIQRPGTGLPPAARSSLVGRVAAQDIPAGTVLTWHMVSTAPTRRGRATSHAEILEG